MALQETIEDMHRTYRRLDEQHGYTNYDAFATAVVGETSPLFATIVETTKRVETKPFLYPNTYETVQAMMDNHDDIVIWTQGEPMGQLWKVGMSGLGELRKSLPHHERHRFSVYAAQDKITPLPQLIDPLITEADSRIIVVDDKAKNIVAATAVIAKAKEEGTLPAETDIRVVWINQGRTKDQVPDGFTPESFKARYATIDSVPDMLSFMDPKKKTTWLLDLDHTLLNTTAAMRHTFEKIAVLKEETHPTVIRGDIDAELGLNGNVLEKQQLFHGGMSGAQIVFVRTQTDAFVIKYNPHATERIQREIAGYRQLADSPLADMLAFPTQELPDKGVLVLPFIPGTQLREGIQAETIPHDLAMQIMHDLFQRKKVWWGNQEKGTPQHGFRSMQREEWTDTVQKLQEVSTMLAKQYRIPHETLWQSPLQFEGKTYPSLLQTTARVSEALRLPPPYTVMTHGDATGANLLVDVANKKARLIDTEWVGPADPAEAFVRMTKHLSSTTIQNSGELSLQTDEDTLIVNLDLSFSPTAVALQEYGLAQVPHVASLLHDPLFSTRVQEYLAGSYLREVALAQKRGNTKLALFAMLKASEAIAS